LNSNLDVFGMQTFLRGLNYVRCAIQARSQPLVFLLMSIYKYGKKN